MDNKLTISKLAFNKRAKTVQVYLDNRTSFSLHLEVVLRRGLTKGQEISPKELAGLRIESVKTDLYQQALGYLQIRPRSRREIETYLKKLMAKQKQQAEGRANLINQIIEKLEVDKKIDDEEFAKWWLKQRVAFRPRGRQALTFELKQKGASQTVVSQVLAQAKESPEYREMVQKAVEAVWQRIKNRGYNRFQAKAVLARRLQGKGFTWRETEMQIDERLAREYNK